MMRMDCHMHSTVSDGSFTIPQLIDRAKRNGLDAIVLTDHDTYRSGIRFQKRKVCKFLQALRFLPMITRMIFEYICWAIGFNVQR